MKKVIKTNMHVYTITENGGKVSMVSDNPDVNFNFEGVETSIDSVMQRFEFAMKLRGEVICEVITDGWVDGEWAWEDDGTKPKAPADPEMKAWLESLGCVFEVDENDVPCLDDAENVRDYFEKNNDERAFFVLPDYDYVCGLFIEYNEDDDIYVAMGNESWNVTEYDGNTDMSVVIADFSNAWAKDIDDYCDLYKGLECDRKIYRNDDYDGYMILLNSGVSHGLNVEEGYDPYKGDYVEVIA